MQVNSSFLGNYSHGFSEHPPGIRLQYQDFQPSGFWITNVNNTFTRNSAVGNNFGFCKIYCMFFSFYFSFRA